MRDFKSQLKEGQAGESFIARWRRARGSSVIPIYEKILDTGKGPQLFLPNEELVAPDLLEFLSTKEVRWIEAKHKTTFTWHHKTQCWTTGIDLRHWKDYLRVDAESPFRVWLLFLHRGGRDKDTGRSSPSGLYGARIAFLKDNVHHEWPRPQPGQPSGMIYWREEVLTYIASIAEMECDIAEAKSRTARQQAHQPH